MDDLILFVQLVFGFILLIKGADYLVNSSVNIANRLKISKFVVGVLLISLGTSLPELTVSIFASLSEIGGSNDGFILGNIIGSNLSNLLLILGISSFITPLFISQEIFKKGFFIYFFVCVLLVFFTYNDYFNIFSSNSVNNSTNSFSSPSSVSKEINFSFLEGIVLLLFFIFYNFILFKNNSNVDSDSVDKKISVLKNIFIFIFSITALMFGANWLVESSSKIAIDIFKVNKDLVGITIVAVGTSLPEIASSVQSARKKEVDLLMGGIIGSNLLNVLFILTFTILINSGISFRVNLKSDIWINFLSLLPFFLLFFFKKNLSARYGFLLICLYLSYIIFVILRG